MTESQDLEEFNKNHPHPSIAGIKTLFRFSKFDVNHIEYLNDLFVCGKLYHSVPIHLNDPFECKPHFNYPKNPSKIRKHLIKVAIKNGHAKKSAESFVSKSMNKPELFQKTIYDAIQKTFGNIRMCSFTTNKENLLFWSHYTDSHKGYCVEYDATIMPISYAFKVQYENDYPEAIYPSPANALGFKPALIKSKAWEYEEEYRIIFIPEAERQPENDGLSLILNGNEIKNIYFGANMTDDNKRILAELINKGPFSPDVWDVSLSKSSFELEFNKR